MAVVTSGPAPRLAGKSSGPKAATLHAHRGWLRATAAIAVGTALISTSGALYGRWIVDDAAITFDYARNIALGYGPVAQPFGPIAEGYSNPAWLALLLAGRMIGVFDRGLLFGIQDYVLYPKLLAVFCSAGILFAIHMCARELNRRPWLSTISAGAALAGTSSFVIWSFSGLENSLYALLVTWLAAVLLVASVRGSLLRPRVAVLAGGLVFVAALTRPDGLIYLGAYPLVALLSINTSSIRRSIGCMTISTAAFAVPYGAFLSIRYNIFGQLVPNTALAKAQALPNFASISRIGELVGYVGWLLVVVLAFCIGVTMLAGGRSRQALGAPLVVLLLALLAYAILMPDWMQYYRFSTPVWPTAILAAVVALPRAAAVLDRRAGLVIGVLLISGLIVAGQQQYQVAQTFRASPTVPLCEVADVTGRGFNGLADILGAPRASLLTPDLGGSSMTSRLALTDLAGLVDPTIAKLRARGDMPGLRDHVFNEVRPTFMAISLDWEKGSGLLADPRVQRDYIPLSSTGFAPGHFVRKDAVSSEAQLARLRTYDQDVVTRGGAVVAPAPRRGCGPLIIGQPLT